MDNEQFWSLVIEPGFVQSAVWTIEGESTRVLSVGPVTAWEDENELITAADTALSATVQNLPEESQEPSKTVFGVVPSWVSDGQISRDHLDKIRKFCSELSLSPTGFVVLPEAIAHFIKSEEGAPLNAVVIGVSKSSLEVTLFKLGNLAGSVSVGRSISAVDDVLESLSRFGSSDLFPSRFLIYGGSSTELEDIRQNLLSADWTRDFADKAKFLHAPQIEIIDSEKKMLAVCLAGASEIGKVSKVEFDSPAVTDLATLGPEDVGFVVNNDIKKVAMKKVFVPVSQRKFTLPKFNLHFARPKVVKFGGRVRFSSMGMGLTTKIAIAAISVSFILVAGLSGWWFLAKADVQILVSPQKLEKTDEITIDTSASAVDFAEKLLPGKKVTANVDGEKTTSSTGSKLVGEKAKGKVLLRNGTGANIDVVAGTVLVGTNDLKFSIQSEASISGATSPTSPGSTMVEIVAVDIGGQYNLTKGETLKVGNYPKSEVDGIVDSDLSGGTSRQITVVSVDDIKSLEKDLNDELLTKAKNELRKNISDEDVFIDETATSQVMDKNFSDKIGDESSNVKLAMTISADGVVVAKQNLNKYALEILKNQVPSGYTLREEQIETSFSKGVTSKNNTWQLSTNFIANLLPSIDSDKISRDISGKSQSVASRYLSKIAGYKSAQIKLNPAFPSFLGFLNTLPHVSGKISIGVTSVKNE